MCVRIRRRACGEEIDGSSVASLLRASGSEEPRIFSALNRRKSRGAAWIFFTVKLKVCSIKPNWVNMGQLVCSNEFFHQSLKSHNSRPTAPRASVMTAAQERTANTASSSPSAETVQTFLAFRRALVRRFKREGEEGKLWEVLESEAFDFLHNSINAGVERNAVLSCAKNEDIRPTLGGGNISLDDPKLLRAYLDARRGFCPPPATTSENDNTSQQQLKTRVTLRLVSDPVAYVTAVGREYRACESMDAADVLVAMRRFDDGTIPNVFDLSLAETRAFIKTWDSSDYNHRNRDKWYVHDFNRFVRFADAEMDARDGSCLGWFDGDDQKISPTKKKEGQRVDAYVDELSFTQSLSGPQKRALHASETVRSQALARIDMKQKHKWNDARFNRRKREGEALVKCLTEEMAVYEAQRSPGVGGVDEPHEFKVNFRMGAGCVGTLTPEPTLALALAATDVPLDFDGRSPTTGGGASGFVTPSEARLAFAQCAVAITALESDTLGDHLFRVGSHSTRLRWHINDLLDVLRCDRLPGEDSVAVVSKWTKSATKTIEVEYLNEGVEKNDTKVELLRYLATPVSAAFGQDAICKVVDACMVPFRKLQRYFAALDNELDVSSGGGRGGGAVSLTNVQYAARIAKCVSPTTTRFTRLQTLAKEFPPQSQKRTMVVRETGESEDRVDWRALLDACGPSQALLEQEKAAGAAPGGVESLKLATEYVLGEERGGPEAGGSPDLTTNSVVDCDDVCFDDDTRAVCASLAKRLFERVTNLRLTLEVKDTRDEGYLLVGDFQEAVSCAGFGPHTFGPDETKWALAACHHPFIENAVLYPKFLAMVVVGIEREVYRRADAAGAMARARQHALDADAERRRAWAFDTMRVVTEAADVAMTTAKARLRNELTAEQRRDVDVARRDREYRAMASNS